MTNTVTTWVVGGAGALLLYSALHKRSPFDVVTGVIGGEQAPATTPATFTSLQQINPDMPAQAGSVAGAIQFARDQIGKPYVHDSNGPNSWDCSSLVQHAYAAIGINIPRTTFQQVNVGIPVDPSNIQPGDLVFVEGINDAGQHVQFGHVGMAIGGGMEIQAPHTGTVVQITPLPDPSRIQAVRRIVQ